MKDENLIKKENNESNSQENINKTISSPKQEQKNSYTNLLLSPDKNSMNQKFFPSKENYFGIKTSPMNIGRSYSPKTHSPILNYYAGISPNGNNLGYYSPKNEYDNNNLNLNINNSNNFSGKLSPNFNYSPSHIFNFQNSSKDIRSNIQNNFNNNEDDSQTLQEKMDPFVRKTDVNNFIKMGSFHQNNLEDNKNEHEEEVEEDDNEEAFTLKIDDFEDFLSEANKQKSKNFSNENIDIQKKTSSEINFNNLNNNNISEQNNINNQNSQNLNSTKPLEIKEKLPNENINNTDNSQIKESLVKNIINKQEFKPYIPNKYRNQMQNINLNSLNSIPNINESPILPHYEINNNLGLIPSFTSNINKNIEPDKINQYINYSNKDINNNKFSLNLNPNNEFNDIKNQNDYDNENLYNNFYYNGDNYKISNFKEYKKKDYLKTGEIPSIGAADIVTAITANNKKIKRIDPNTYLNESIEYLSYNIFPLARDQAGCRFLQEKIEIDPIHTTESFYKSILPFVLPLAKDPFGNYLLQKLFKYLSPEQIQTILEIITPTILDIGSNSHGTRVIQTLINFLTTKQLVNCFLNSIKPYVIPLLKELNGTHIINKFLYDHPEHAEEINKIIIENCSLLATHRHGCCILQKMLEGKQNKKFRTNLINNLIENCFVLIIDQYGNYVIQSILLLNDNRSSSAIAMKICDNIAYYSKHRYSSNVIEKCFDFCGRKEKRKLIEKISSPEVISELILDEHGNYVIQKALCYADYKEKEIILNYIKPLIPQIKNTLFGEKLLYRLFTLYPQLNSNNYNYIYNNNENNLNDYFENNSYNNKGNKKRGKKKKKNNTNNKDDNNNYVNNEKNDNNLENNNELNNNELNNNDNTNNNNDVNNNNVSLNNYYNINNNTINININSNNNSDNNISNNQIDYANNNLVNNHTETDNLENNNNYIEINEPKKKKKKKKGKKKKKKIKENNNIENNENNEDLNKNDDNIDSKKENEINQNNIENEEIEKNE